MFFQSREMAIVRRIGWVMKTLEAKVGQFLLGCKCPMSRGIFVQEQELPWWSSRSGFPSKCPSVAPEEISNTPLWQFGPLEEYQWGGCCLDPKKYRREIFQRIFALGIFWGEMSRYAATPLIVALSPCRSDITRFRPWTPIATENHLYSAENIPNLAPLTFLIRVQAFRDPLRRELSHVQIFMNDGSNPLTWDAQFLSYWFSRNPVVLQD